MKIAVWHNLPSGGGKRALYLHIKGLVERGHFVECWCPSTADRSYLPLNELTVEHVRPVAWPDATMDMLPYTIADARTVNRRLRALDEHARICAREIESRQFDLVFANPCTFFRVPAISRYTTLPSVLYLQEPYRHLYEALPELPWLAAPPFSWRRPSHRAIKRMMVDYFRTRACRIQARAELTAARAFKTILVNSLFSRESLLRAYNIDAKVCYLGIDTSVFADRDLQRDNFVVGIGSFTKEKRIDFVMYALAHLPDHHRHLVWIGNIASPAYLNELKALAATLKISFEPRVGITDQEIVETLNRAALMAYAPRLEPFGLAPLEANACGLPVVAVAEGGVRETIVDGLNGILCAPEPRAMAAAMASLFENAEYRRRLGKSAVVVVRERWSANAAITRLEERLSEALERRYAVNMTT